MKCFHFRETVCSAGVPAGKALCIVELCRRDAGVTKRPYGTVQQSEI